MASLDWSPSSTSPASADRVVRADAYAQSVCRACAQRLEAPFLDLGDLPLANAFTDGTVSPDEEFTCPLRVAYCPGCHLVQLTHVVPPERMFSSYLYVSSTSQTFQRHFRDYAEAVARWFPARAIGVAVDIGSNDGALVQAFLDRGVAAIGIEPATNLSDEANRRGRLTLNRYFDASCVSTILGERGPVDIVTANNVFAHVADVRTLCRHVRELLRDDGVFVIECPYVVTMCEQMLFDMIYHEHLSYFSVSALHALLERCELEILEVEEVSSHGGSLRVTSQKAGGPRQSDGRWMTYLRKEEQGGYHGAAVYARFAAGVYRATASLRAFVAAERASGAALAGYGAPAKATTLINVCGWSVDDLRYLVDDNPLKQGLYAPGSRIPVVHADALIARPPDAMVVFAWNFAEEIVRRMRARVPSHVRWMTPLPTPRYI